MIVDNKAPDSGIVFEEIETAQICPHLKVLDLQQEAGRIANRFVIVDDGDHSPMGTQPP